MISQPDGSQEFETDIVPANSINRVETLHSAFHRLDPEVARRWLAGIVESADDAIVGKTLDSVITSWNQGAERLFGYSADEAVGKSVTMLIPPGREDEEPSILAQLRAGRRVDHFETLRRHKDGQLIEISLTVSPILGPDGALIGASKVARDISERRRAEEELREALARAEDAHRVADEASQAKSEFLSRMSHELRTPLNAIIGFAQLLEMRLSDKEDIEASQYVLKAGRHLLDLINEVLDISRVEAGRLHLSMEPVAVRVVLRDALTMVEPLASQYGVTIDPHQALAYEGYILADHQRLKQVLINLLANAVKYNRTAGEVTVQCQPGDNNRVCLSIRDTGIGIPSEWIGRLFSPFDRLNAPQNGIEGTGLGLTLSKRLVEAMDGNIRVDSKPDVGSTFSVEFEGTASPDSPDMVELLSNNGISSNETGPPFTVLCIEDNISNYRLIEMALSTRPGIYLMTALQGSMGLQLAKLHRPGLILLDLHLPDMHGSDVLVRLRSDDDTRDIPVIIVSADATPRQIERLMNPALGRTAADGYITKPIDVHALCKIIDEYRDRVRHI